MKKTKSSGGIILRDNNVVIVSQKGRSWSLPKGHVENDESLINTAYREIYEETGIEELELLTYIGHYTRYKLDKNNNDDKREEKNIHLYLFKTQQQKTTPLDPDNPELKWVDINEVEQYLSHPKDKDFFKQHIPLIKAYTSNIICIETTFKSKEEAQILCKNIIDSHLAACCQISPEMTSIYTWENTLCEDKEYRCSIKTNTESYKKLSSFIKENHSYDCPQIIAYPSLAADYDYSQWLNRSITLI
ncbi:hypothetical protein DID78_00800 [Candidatus Marinamargulisbacteria bacterium SCGC AG-343-D04]|nr:hypothetical protein DID78_00800 [Candidatus Marinamargulisbacteria bacterium SCGC AG-343-D04]